jgi:hypothetical protein
MRKILMVINKTLPNIQRNLLFIPPPPFEKMYLPRRVTYLKNQCQAKIQRHSLEISN